MAAVALAVQGRELAEVAGASRFVVGLRNLLRRPGRSIMTGAAVAISMALLISMASISEGIKDTARLGIVESREDLVVSPEQGARLERAHAMDANVSGWPEVELATVAAYHELTVETTLLGDKGVYAAGLVPGEFWEMAGETERERYKGGFFRVPDDPFYGNGSYDGAFTGEVLVSKNLVDKYGVAVGGELPVRLVPGAEVLADRMPVREATRAGQPVMLVNLTVVGSFELEYSGSGFYKGLAIIVMHLSELQAVANMAAENGTGGGPPVVTDLANGLSISLTDTAVREGSVGAVDSRLKEAYPQYADYVYTREEQLAQQRDEFVVAEVFYLAVGSVSMLIGLLFVATIMIVSVMERTREIGMMRSIGISRWSIFLQVFEESMVLVLVGALIGVLPGYWGASWAASYISTRIGLTIQLGFSTAFVARSLLLVLAVGALFATYPAITAVRMNIVKAVTGAR